MMRHTLAFISVIAIALASSDAFGQAQDSNVLTVYVPPAMSLRALRPDVNVTHPETPGNIRMTNSLWWATTASSTGSTIRFTSSTPFINQSVPSVRRDVRLTSPRLFGSGSAGWSYNVATDQTDYANGDNDAQVEITGTGPGIALIFLEVVFITGDLPSLAGGDYVTTVVGTITAN